MGCDSSKKPDKYGKQKSPKEIKVDEHSERRRGKLCAMESYRGKKEAGGKTDRGQEGKRSQANWKNTGEVARIHKALVYKSILKEDE